jgi:hypothetical protein
MLVVIARCKYIVRSEDIPQEYRPISSVVPIILNHTKQQYNSYALHLP